jgi:hypothetical protein
MFILKGPTSKVKLKISSNGIIVVKFSKKMISLELWLTIFENNNNNNNNNKSMNIFITKYVCHNKVLFSIS